MTDLETLLATVRRHDRRFVVYRHGGERALAERFAAHAVDVEHRDLPRGGPEPFLVIEADGEFAGAIALDELRWLLEPPIVRPAQPDEVSAGYRVLFDVLDETVFTALSRRQLLAVSREIEDRALRVGDGTLHASFQLLSAFESQVERYRRLAETGLAIHVYGVADWSPPEIPGVRFHERSDPTLDRYWALAFDGGSEPMQACGLVGQETADGYDGFWTDDAGLAGRIADALVAAG